MESEDLSKDEIILHDPELVERIFELRFTIAESESIDELMEIKVALFRDYDTEIKKLTETFIK
jgi:hypothetical protein